MEASSFNIGEDTIVDIGGVSYKVTANVGWRGAEGNTREVCASICRVWDMPLTRSYRRVASLAPSSPTGTG